MTQILSSAVAILAAGETLTAVMSGAVTTVAPHYACWFQDSSNPLCNQKVGALNGATAVTIAPAPDSGVPTRVVQSVRIFNADSANVTVTISKVVAAGTFTLAKVTLETGDHLIFDERGMIVLNSSGQAESVSA